MTELRYFFFLSLFSVACATDIIFGPYRSGNATNFAVFSPVSSPWSPKGDDYYVSLSGVYPAPSAYSSRLEIKNFGGFSNLPIENPSPLIAGISVNMRFFCNASSVVDMWIALQRTTQETPVASQPKTNVIVPSNGNVPQVYGSSTDLWGYPFSVNDITAQNFGVQVNVTNRSGVSYVQLMDTWIEVFVKYNVSVTKIQPATQSNLNGGVTVTITGVNFVSSASTVAVRFGEYDVTCNLLSRTSISCVTPAVGDYGSYPIFVSLGNDVWTEEEAITFTYVTFTTSPLTTQPLTTQPLTSGLITTGLITSGLITTGMDVTTGSITTQTVSLTGAGTGNPDPTGNPVSTETGPSSGPSSSPSSGPSTTSEASSTGESESRLVPIVAGSVGGAVFVAIIALLVVVVRKRKGITYGFYRPKFEEFLFAADAKPLYQVSKDDKVVLEEMERVLMEPGLPLVKAIAQLTSVTDSESIARSMVLVFASNNKITELITTMINSEVEVADSEGTMFRKNDFTSKLLKVYSTLVGLDYLFDCLGKLIRELYAIHSSNFTDEHVLHSLVLDTVEVDPQKLTNDDDVSINKLQLQLLTQKIFNSIIRQVNAVPVALRFVCNTIREGVAKKFSEDAARKAVGGFIFLRYICPSLISPHSYYLCKDPPDSETQRQLLLVAKVLQNLSNGVQFGRKEEYMAPLNSFIQDNGPKMQKFFDEVTILPGDWMEDMNTECAPIPAGSKENALCVLFNQIHSLAKKIEKELESQPEQISKLSAILSTPAIPLKPVNVGASTRLSRFSKSPV
eukprot:TRINITY_DN2900_c0_g1_i3.p1 TRINITY_DN2900_c0_g1~~TRINITY_DN2900_c0_g1_i3.p1  ORF type:complete len:791 (-),score=205.27 TRINITY_DN2900_c0_g1_i3:16-2388(-)